MDSRGCVCHELDISLISHSDGANASQLFPPQKISCIRGLHSTEAGDDLIRQRQRNAKLVGGDLHLGGAMHAGMHR